MAAKKHKKMKRTLVTLAILVVIYAILYIITPSVSSYYQVSGEEKIIAGLEVPLLEEGETLIIHEGYSLVYDEQIESAKWVAYHLTKDELYGLFERKDNFRADPLIKTGSAVLDDYRNSGYDRGHLVPAADLSFSKQAMSDSFYLSNMSPQEPSFNRGIWADLEAVVRNFADQNGHIYITTGPIFYNLDDTEYIGKSSVAIPDAYYKVILDYQEPELKAIAFILPNEGSSRPLESFATSVDEVESLVSVDFFPLVEDDIEENLEGSFNVALWDFSPFRASREDRLAYQESIEDDNSVVTEVPKQSFASLLLDIMMSTKKEIQTILGSFELSDIEGLFQ